MSSFARAASAVAACLAVIVLAGCAANPGVGSVSRGVPDGVTLDPFSEGPAAVWIDRGESFAVVTLGSSSCPAMATEVSASRDDRVSVTFGPSPSTTCTADMAPTTHTFDLPAGVSGDAISVEIHFEEWPEVYTIALD
ncbi:hypothetical protein P0L94_07920 [Microbacter sp. GSS18]|nr:hypothetical protein P0L94_07920 [Microbacter sp. GSS18]